LGGEAGEDDSVIPKEPSHNTVQLSRKGKDAFGVQQIVVQRRNAHYDICLSKTSISAYTTNGKHPVVVFVDASSAVLSLTANA
jgi:hypothetical protein